MSKLAPFRKIRGNWFECPHCGHCTYTSLVGAMFSTSRTFIVIYKCHDCGQLAKLRHPALLWASTLPPLLLVFPFAYSLMLHFSGQWPFQAPVLFGAVFLGILFQAAISRMIYRYIILPNSDVI